MLGLFLIKLFIAIGVVVLFSVIAEHVSTRVAGILSGYPTGSAISLFFFGLEISPEFAADSAVYNMIGLVAMQSFMYFYYKSSSYFRKYNRYGIILSSVVSIAGYFVVAWLLHFIKLNKFVSVFIPILSMVLFYYLFREIENVKINNNVKLSFNVLLLRAIFAASIILTVIGAGKLLGSTWAGLLSAFPTTVFPLILIIHYTYDVGHVHTIIKNITIGIGSLIFYSLSISISYPLYGIYVGTLVSFFVATVYLLMFQFIKGKLKHIQP